jgi:hypothetical protein
MGTLSIPFKAPKPVSPMPADSPHSELSWFYSFGVMAWRSLVFIFPKTFGIFMYPFLHLLIGPFFCGTNLFKKKMEKPQLYPIQAR